jgi:hypothetical protein
MLRKQFNVEAVMLIWEKIDLFEIYPRKPFKLAV